MSKQKILIYTEHQTYLADWFALINQHVEVVHTTNTLLDKLDISLYNAVIIDIHKRTQISELLRTLSIYKNLEHLTNDVTNNATLFIFYSDHVINSRDLEDTQLNVSRIPKFTSPRQFFDQLQTFKPQFTYLADTLDNIGEISDRFDSNIVYLQIKN